MNRRGFLRLLGLAPLGLAAAKAVRLPESKPVEMDYAVSGSDAQTCWVCSGGQVWYEDISNPNYAWAAEQAREINGTVDNVLLRAFKEST